ncbi:glycosyltransferase family 2 protein [Candidatus Roizmanbacteria bacterium]|nr:glycosyltransferase family 2 protein [Candidatus Roizmanbacteria bacterium]
MISAIILTKNEEENIGRCLKSVKWCDEIVVIDDYSTDRTLEIARKHKVAIYPRSLNNDFSAQRNFGISKANNDWVIFVDADEVVSDALAYEISSAIQLKGESLEELNGFHIRRIDFMWGRELKYGETGNVKLLRLGRKGKGFWKGMAHEKWEIKGPLGKLLNPLQHFPHPTLTEFLKEINFYTDIRAGELKIKKTKVFFWSVLIYPLSKFLLNYFLKKGFMDGTRGLIFAIIMSFHSFLARSKLWLKTQK